MQFAMPSLTPVVKGIVIANIAVFVVTVLMTLRLEWGLWDFIGGWFGLKPDRWISFFPPVWQLVSYGFLHDPVDVMHILMNMLFIYFLGTMLEGIIGGRRFLSFYLSAIIAAGVGQLLFNLLTKNYSPTVGASGAVLAVVVAIATLRPQMRLIFIIFPLTMRTFAMIYVGLDVWRLISEARGMGGNVAYIAHLSGALWGFLLVKKGWIWMDPLESLERWKSTRDSERAAADDLRLDDLLAKINREGIHSLSAREKAFLKRASKRN